MVPFVLLSLFETLYQEHTFRQRFYEYFFPIFHVVEVCLLGLAVILLRGVWDEFSIKREITIIFWVMNPHFVTVY